MKLFAYYGYDGVTHEMIATESGTVKSSIGKLFGSKEQLAVLCAEQIVENVAAEVKKITEKGLTYDEHTKQVCTVFKQHRDELRFLCTLLLTPSLTHMAANLFSEVFKEKVNILLPYKEAITPELFEDTLFMMNSLHFTYILGGNEEKYESARRRVIESLNLKDGD